MLDRNIKHISKWAVRSTTYANGSCEEYKKVKKIEKPFPFEDWWRVVMDEPKWLNRDVAAVIRNKRNKVSASGAYTSSSNQDTEEAQEIDRPRPQGQKAAKEQRKRKGKGKGKAGNGRLSDDSVGQLSSSMEGTIYSRGSWSTHCHA